MSMKPIFVCTSDWCGLDVLRTIRYVVLAAFTTLGVSRLRSAFCRDSAYRWHLGYAMFVCGRIA
jgi:hypothetical protein